MNSYDPNESIHFNTFQEVENFFNNPVDFENDPPIQNQDGTHTTSFRVKLGLTNINIEVKQILKDPQANQNYNSQGVSSSYTGLTLGSGWTQTSYNFSVDNSQNIVTVDLYGELNYNLFIEGVGTVFSEQMHYQMKINILTGEAISITKQ